MHYRTEYTPSPWNSSDFAVVMKHVIVALVILLSLTQDLNPSSRLARIPMNSTVLNHTFSIVRHLETSDIRSIIVNVTCKEMSKDVSVGRQLSHPFLIN